MSEQKHKDVLRALGDIEIVQREDGETSRKVRFTISTEARDRHGTIIRIGAWNITNYNKNGVVAYQHKTSSSWWTDADFNPDNIIGKGKAWIDKESKALMGEAEFEPAEINPLADKIYQKIQFGTLKAVSVGFIARKGHMGLQKDGEDTGTFYFDDVELLEFSVVNIPSNPEALKRQFDDAALEFAKNHTPQPEEEIAIPQTLSARRARINFLNINHKTHNDKYTVKRAART